MSVFHAMGLIVKLVALFGYLNHRFIGLPDTVGITAIGLVAALGVTAYGACDPAVVEWVGRTVERIDSYAVEILLTLAMATAGYGFAEYLHTSTPIAVVIMGLLIGNHGKRLAMSEQTREHLSPCWDLADELLNLPLFGLIGIEIVALAAPFHASRAGADRDPDRARRPAGVCWAAGPCTTTVPRVLAQHREDHDLGRTARRDFARARIVATAFRGTCGDRRRDLCGRDLQHPGAVADHRAPGAALEPTGRRDAALMLADELAW
ncbi:MAG: cation:proton antiporter [Burkholderiales bacterium]